jgi:hypothetical protein
MAPPDESVVEEMRSAGVNRILFGVNSQPAPEASGQIHDLAALAARLG